jgi:hypothetical protein
MSFSGMAISNALLLRFPLSGPTPDPEASAMGASASVSPDLFKAVAAYDFRAVLGLAGNCVNILRLEAWR